MMRHRSGPPPSQESSSSDEEDAFSALSKKRKRKSAAAEKNEGKSSDADQSVKEPTEDKPIVPSQTSSNKRHHGVLSDSRKAKMDALLEELVDSAVQSRTEEPRRRGGSQDIRKKGSFVEPGEEHLTTNIFVGNLAPSITEEQMTELFQQFGDLHSVKIMWPRNAEERARNRHTGFVCFVNRADAEDAMEACAEADPFNVGRRLFMRWGKNVKNIVKPGTVGPSILQKKKRAPMKGPHNNNDTMAGGVHSPAHALDAERAVRRDDTATIRVVVPRDPRRAHFISTVASFVATDGSQLESMLMDREYNNPDFDFLHYHPARGDDPEWLRIQQEHIFYKWRVYSFCQEDSGYHNWREQPFTMFAGGCTWIPPPRDTQAALREQEEVRRREEAIAREKEQRRFHSAKRGFLTGRQLENQKRNKKVDGGSILTAEDRRELDRLFRQQLCLSRGSICEAMAFCFEKSAAAKIISSELKDMLSERGADVKTMVSRLYLLSDILFNSQQPGVRNAFLYRDAIQQMASDVFASLGLYAGNESSLGRMSRGRLSTAVHSVLAAWTNWGVFDHVFLDELQARFEGREIVAEKISVEEPNTQETEEKVKENPSSRNQTTCVVSKPRGDWTDVTHDVRDNNRADKVSSERKKEPEDTNEFDPDGIPLDEEEGEGDPDGIPVDDSELTHDAQGQDIPTSTAPHRLTMEMEAMRDENDPDGEPLEGDDPDGEPLDHADGEPLDGDCDGELLY